MSFVPVGFWQRFIARMLISLAEMDLQVAPERIRHRDGWASKSILLGGGGEDYDFCADGT